MARKIYARRPPPPPGRRRRPAPSPEPRRDALIVVHMESADPRVLDTEARKLYEKLTASGAELIGPLPVPVRLERGEEMPDAPRRVFRRIIHITKSTEKTMGVLEKLPVSQHLSIFLEVEEAG